MSQLINKRNFAILLEKCFINYFDKKDDEEWQIDEGHTLWVLGKSDKDLEKVQEAFLQILYRKLRDHQWCRAFFIKSYLLYSTSKIKKLKKELEASFGYFDPDNDSLFNHIFEENIMSKYVSGQAIREWFVEEKGIREYNKILIRLVVSGDKESYVNSKSLFKDFKEGGKKPPFEYPKLRTKFKWSLPLVATMIIIGLTVYFSNLDTPLQINRDKVDVKDSVVVLISKTINRNNDKDQFQDLLINRYEIKKSSESLPLILLESNDTINNRKTAISKGEEFGADFVLYGGGNDFEARGGLSYFAIVTDKVFLPDSIDDYAYFEYDNIVLYENNKGNSSQLDGLIDWLVGGHFYRQKKFNKAIKQFENAKSSGYAQKLADIYIINSLLGLQDTVQLKKILKLNTSRYSEDPDVITMIAAVYEIL